MLTVPIYLREFAIYVPTCLIKNHSVFRISIAFA